MSSLCMKTRRKSKKEQQQEEQQHAVQEHLLHQNKRGMSLLQVPWKKMRTQHPLHQNTESSDDQEDSEAFNATQHPGDDDFGSVPREAQDSPSAVSQVGDVLGAVWRAYRDEMSFQQDKYTSRLINTDGWWYLKDGRLVIPDVDIVK